MGHECRQSLTVGSPSLIRPSIPGKKYWEYSGHPVLALVVFGQDLEALVQSIQVDQGDQGPALAHGFHLKQAGIERFQLGPAAESAGREWKPILYLSKGEESSDLEEFFEGGLPALQVEVLAGLAPERCYGLWFFHEGGCTWHVGSRG